MWATRRKVRAENEDIFIDTHGTTPGGKGAAWNIPGPSYTVKQGDQLEWEQLQFGGYGGPNLAFSDGSQTYGALHDNSGQTVSAWQTEGEWEYRSANLSNYAGKTITTYQLVDDTSSPAGTYDIYYEAMAIVSTDGTVTPIYYRRLGDTLPNVWNTGQTNLSAVEKALNPSSAPQQNNNTYYIADHLGSARMLTANGGWPVSTDTFYPFGQETGSPAGDNTFKFTGKERDSESGNDYFGARFYGSSMGRFMSPDPLPWIHWQHGDEDDQKKFAGFISNPQNFNMYTYVNNNPLNKTDPTGMNACGTNNDSGCQVTVTLQDRTKDANGHYNDQFAGRKGNGDYNATATVSVNGTVVGTFLASTVPSGPGLAKIENGTYSGTLGSHDGHAAIRINGGGPVPVVGGRDPATGAPNAVGILVHIAGLPTSEHPLGGTGMTHSGKAISEGCQLVCSTQYGAFERATGLRPVDRSEPQHHFTVTVDTLENQ